MLTFMIQTYAFFYIFTRFKFAHEKPQNEGEEFAYRVAMFPIFIELITVSILIIETVEFLMRKDEE